MPKVRAGLVQRAQVYSWGLCTRQCLWLFIICWLHGLSLHSPPPPLQDGMQIHCRVTPQCWIRQYLGGGSNEPLDPKASALTTRPPRLRWLHMRCLYFMQCEKYQKTSDGVQFVRPIPNAVLLPRRTQYGTAVARCLNLGWQAEFSSPRLLSTAGLAVPPARL